MPYHTLTQLPLMPIGRVCRSKGYQGELVLHLDSGLFVQLQSTFVFLYLDGLPVPFRLEYCRGTRESFVLKLSRINDSESADRLRGVRVAISEDDYSELLEQQEDQGVSPDALVGFTVLHPSRPTAVGRIVHISDRSANPLFYIDTEEGREVLIPIVREWIKAVDIERRAIHMDFPLDLLDI